MLHKWHKRTPAAIYTQKETILAIKFYLYACIDLFTDFKNIGSHCMCVFLHFKAAYLTGFVPILIYYKLSCLLFWMA